jgi:hypothetical protein
MRAIGIVWAATFLIFGLAATYAQMSYEPAPVKTADAKSTDGGEPQTTTETDTPPKTDNTGDASYDDELNTSTATNTEEEANPETQNDVNTDGGMDTEETTTDTNATNTNTETTGSTTGAAPLIAAPDPELITTSAHGPIPATINGREPWRYYASKVSIPEGRPRISIVLTEAGLSTKNTNNAFNRLSNKVTFAFSPYAKDLPQWLGKARKGGYETLMMVPMEPIDYPKNDPGRHTLLTTHSPAQVLDRLHFVMSRAQGYVGVMNDMGSKFTANREAMNILITDLQKRGLMFLDGRTTRFTVGAQMARDAGVPRAMNDRYLDNTIRPTDIDKYLNDLESVAKTYGTAVGIGRAYPITIQRIALWAETLNAKGIDLVPITAVANRQPIR